MPAHIKLVVGLGNPGPKYSDTRHNAGFWFAERLIAESNSAFSDDSKFYGETARMSLDDEDLRLLKPATFMNHSGRAVQAIAAYFDIRSEEILVAHDEIDLGAGTARIKLGGGHGGHNGLRDIIECLGSRDFLRLRIGVGHPGNKDDVIDYVLRSPGAEEKKSIEGAVSRAVEVMPVLMRGELNKAMTLLNGYRQESSKGKENEPNDD